VLNLSRELATAQAANDALAERAQELGVLKASTIGTVRIVDPAATPLKPIAPRKSLTLALASLLGVALGIALALLRERFRRGIEGSAQIEALDIPVFATISLHLTKKNIKGNAPIGDVLCRDTPDSIIVEEFKSLRTSLHFAMLDAKNQSIGITSGAPGVGKSFVAANIAAVSASAGFKVCLVDADMRRGRQGVRFGFKRSVTGLSEYLSGETGLDSVLKPTDIEGLTFLPTGTFPPNPSELLMRNHFNDLISSLCERFDLVVVDCPPILAVTDAAIMGRTLGANFIVARHQVTELGEIVASRTALDAAGVPLKGAMLNAFDRRKARNQGGKGGKYGYSYAYSYAYKTLEKD
jgi:tyrosine-protein kinase Etk/Wzc